MSKKWAMVFFSFLDVIGLLMIWWTIHQTQHVYFSVAAHTDHISFHSRTGLGFFPGILFPVAHAIMICKYLWPAWVQERISSIDKCITIFGIALLGGGILFTLHLQAHVSKANYLYCPSASGPGIVSKMLVYARDDTICRRLTEENAERFW